MKSFLFSLVLFSYTAFGNEARNLSFQIARPVIGRQITIDGKLKEDVWKKADVHTAYYVYRDKQGKPGELKTESRLLYDKNGVYLARCNYGDPTKIRRTITTNSHIDIWTDDCAEIYFNPLCDKVSYRRCAVNANGSVHTMLRDATLLSSEFYAPGTKIQCETLADGWNIEAFFSWSDLGKEATPGDVWTFCHVRYAWPDGKFIGVSSSVMGSIYNIGAFGILYFALDNRELSVVETGHILAQKVPPSWGLQMEGKLIFNDGKCLSVERADRMFSELFIQCRDSVERLEKQSTRKPAEVQALGDLRKKLNEIMELQKTNPLQAVLELKSISREIRQFEWLEKIENKYN